MNIFKKLSFGLATCILIIFPLFLSSCFITDLIMGSGSDTGVEISRVGESENGKITEEEFEALINWIKDMADLIPRP